MAFVARLAAADLAAPLSFQGERMTKERLRVEVDLASDYPIKLPTGWVVRSLRPERTWPSNPTRIVIELERKQLFGTVKTRNQP